MYMKKIRAFGWLIKNCTNIRHSKYYNHEIPWHKFMSECDRLNIRALVKVISIHDEEYFSKTTIGCSQQSLSKFYDVSCGFGPPLPLTSVWIYLWPRQDGCYSTSDYLSCSSEYFSNYPFLYLLLLIADACLLSLVGSTGSLSISTNASRCEIHVVVENGSLISFRIGYLKCVQNCTVQVRKHLLRLVTCLAYFLSVRRFRV